MRVKICGITSEQDAVEAARYGADAIGLVFYAPSSRNVPDLDLARDICLAAGPFISTVGLFVNAESDFIDRVLSKVPLSLLQFHGDELEADCRQYYRPFIKALRMKPGEDISRKGQQYPSAQGILLDAYRPGVPGGTGDTFDWQKIPGDLDKPLILAGGLSPLNIRAAVESVAPWAVDVSGGVELRKGVKDQEKVRQFIRLAKGQAEHT